MTFSNAKGQISTGDQYQSSMAPASISASSSWNLQAVEKEYAEVMRNRIGSHGGGGGRSISATPIAAARRGQHTAPRTPRTLNSGQKRFFDLTSSGRIGSGGGDEEINETIVSVFYMANKVGAAVFNTASCKLSLFNDMPDGKPNFEILGNLMSQTNPDHVITSARLDEDFRNETILSAVSNYLNLLKVANSL